MTFTASDAWALAAACACAAVCAIPGCFLMLRRLSLLGDAISHAVLPGLALAYLLTGSRDAGPMLLGAAGAAVVTGALTGALSRVRGVTEDAAMGVVFTTLFAIGVLLISALAARTDLDAGCVLYGELLHVPLRRAEVFGMLIPRAVLVLSVVLVVVAGLAAAFYKELKITTFDPQLAAAMGISPAAVAAGLLAATAASSVASFEAVGSVLVVAMLIAPPATAHLLTDRLGVTLLLAPIIGCVGAVLGYAAAIRLDATPAGCIAGALGVLFAAALVASPRHGVLVRVAHAARLRVRIACEDILGRLYRAEENPARAEVRAGGLPIADRAALAVLRVRGSVTPAGGLTEKGRAEAAKLVRAHRLWETFLARELNMPTDHLHEPSHRAEHYISRAVRERLGRDMDADLDPQGKPIPPADGGG